MESPNHPDYFRIDVEDMRIASLVEAIGVWRNKCVGQACPVWGDLHFLDFADGLIPFMMLVDFDGQPGFGSYRFWGSKVASANARDMTGLRISDLAPPRHAQYSEEQYRWVVAHGKPALFVACLGEKSWDRKYEAVLRLPCRSTSDAGIDRIFSIGYYDDIPETIEGYIDAEIDLHNYFDPDAET